MARLQQFVVKRMPDKEHHPSCPSYEPPEALSGLACLLGGAIVEKSQVLARVES